MYGGYALGLIKSVYTRKPKEAFGALKYYENRKVSLDFEAIPKHDAPKHSIFTPETLPSKIWRWAQMAFVVGMVCLFVVLFCAMVMHMA